MANALVPRNDTLPAEREWATMMQMGEVLFRSGMLPAHIKNAAASVAIIQKGKELGIPPMHALSNIAVIQGKPTANSELMLALIYRDHGDDAVMFHLSTDKDCHIAYKRRAWKEYRTHGFTIEEAKQAGLVKQGPWQQYPAAMLRARCISAVARMAFPDSIGGMYTPEELGADVDADGMVIATPAAVHALPAPEKEWGPEPHLESQRKRMWATAKEKGWTNEQVHNLLTVEFPAAIDQETKKPSTKSLNRNEMDLLTRMVSYPPPFAEAIEGEVTGEQPALRMEADE